MAFCTSDLFLSDDVKKRKLKTLRIFVRMQQSSKNLTIKGGLHIFFLHPIEKSTRYVLPFLCYV